MEQETKGTDGVGQGGGLVPDVLGQVGAGAIPGVLPVQRGSDGVSDGCGISFIDEGEYRKAIENNRPTPETDAVERSTMGHTLDDKLTAHANLARRLQRERDEARVEAAKYKAWNEESKANAARALHRADREIAELRAEVERLRQQKCEWGGSVSRCALAGKQDDDPRHDPTRYDQERDEANGAGAWAEDGREL